MHCDEKNKVCFDIMGKAAVVRVIESLKQCGIEKFVIVVGNKAESVMNAVSGIKGVTFAYQKEQLGTGNAALCGLNVLDDFNIEGPVLIVMGDKLIDESVFKTLIEDFYEKDCDVSLVTQPSEFNKSGGKIILEDDRVSGIVEHMDLLLLKLREGLKTGASEEKIFAELKLNEKQIQKIRKKLDEYADDEECCISLNGKNLSSEDIIESGLVNCATYLYKREALERSICNLNSDNAQNELYFTDTVMNIARDGFVSYVTVEDKSLIQTFNTVEELEAINRFFKEKTTHESV